MSRHDEFMSALNGRVSYQGKTSDAHADALAHAYARTTIDPEDVSSIGGFDFGSQSVPGIPGVRPQAVYRGSTNRIVSAQNPVGMMGMGPNIQNAFIGGLAHETHHGVSNVHQPEQFGRMMQSRQGRADAERGADDYAAKHFPAYNSPYKKLAQSRDPGLAQYMDVARYLG